MRARPAQQALSFFFDFSKFDWDRSAVLILMLFLASPETGLGSSINQLSFLVTMRPFGCSLAAHEGLLSTENMLFSTLLAWLL